MKIFESLLLQKSKNVLYYLTKEGSGYKAIGVMCLIFCLDMIALFYIAGHFSLLYIIMWSVLAFLFLSCAMIIAYRS
jgi:phosphoglycerol transferase MdoB-like AlkP superfamily enzyme